jgi:hypothetical protein
VSFGLIATNRAAHRRIPFSGCACVLLVAANIY